MTLKSHLIGPIPPIPQPGLASADVATQHPCRRTEGNNRDSKSPKEDSSWFICLRNNAQVKTKLQISFVRNTTSNKIAFLFAQLFDVGRLISNFSLKKMCSQKQSGARSNWCFLFAKHGPNFSFLLEFLFYFCKAGRQTDSIAGHSPHASAKSGQSQEPVVLPRGLQGPDYSQE